MQQSVLKTLSATKNNNPTSLAEPTTPKSLQQLIETYKNIVLEKNNDFTQGRIHYDWHRAQLSHLNSLEIHPLDIKLQALNLMITLQEIYIDRLIPTSYTYFAITDALTKTDINKALRQEFQSVAQGRNDYQDIQVHLTLRQQIGESMLEEQDKEKLTNMLEKYREASLLVVLKIEAWQNQMSELLKHPVFFIWNHRHCLNSLGQNRIAAHIASKMPERRFLIEPNPLLLESEWQSLNGKQLVNRCLQILRQQRGRQLQLVLALPFYAKSQKQQPVLFLPSTKQKDQGKKINSSVRNNVIVGTASVAKKNDKMQKMQVSLAEQQLAVIRKFRSLNYRPIRTAHHQPTINTIQTQQPINSVYQQLPATQSPLASKLSSLKLQLQLAVPSPRQKTTQAPTKLQNIIPQQQLNNKTKSTIRLILEKEIDLSIKKPQLGDLGLANKEKQGLNRQNKTKDGSDQQRLIRLTRQSELVMAQMKQQRQLLTQKSSSLAGIRTQLLTKIKQTSNSNNKDHLNQQTTSPQKMSAQIKQSSTLRRTGSMIVMPQNTNKQSNLKEKKNQPLNKQSLNSPEVIQQKLRLQQRQQQFANKHKQSGVQSQLVKKQLQQERDRGQMVREKLMERKMRIQAMQHQLQHPKQWQGEVGAQMAKARIKQQLLIQHRQQKLGQAEDSLKQQLKMQQLHHQQLVDKEQEQQQRRKEQFQREIAGFRAKFQGQLKKMQASIQDQQRKRKQYQQSLVQQSQATAKMQSEVQRLAQREQQLMEQLEKTRQQSEARRQAQRKRQQLELQAQMERLKQKEQQELEQYRRSNQQLMVMLKDMKAKNQQLESKVG